MTSRRRALAAACLLAAVHGAATGLRAQEPGAVAGRLRNVEIATRDVFSDQQAEDHLFYRLANALHMVTREQVIEREVWLRRGQPITWDEIAELERNLRAMSLFGAATVTARPLDDGQVDLLVDTRDEFSLSASGSVARVGGVDKFSFRLAESNLLGTGKELVLAGNREEGEDQNHVRYTDRQLFGSWHRFSITTGQTEEGPFTNVDLRRPFKHLADPASYGNAYEGVREDKDYYRFGETTAEVPLRSHSARMFVAAADGPPDSRWIRGLDLRVSSAEYGIATGPDAGLWRVPGDTDAVEFGPYVRYELRTRYDKVTHLDAMDYLEDLTLGVTLGARLAARLRDEEGAGSGVDPVLEVTARAASQPLPESYLTFAATGDAAFGSDRLHSWRSSLALHAYQMSLPQQTLAGSLTFDIAGDRQDLVPQLTLGEDNGLRGYPAREFAGSRFFRLNLEDRVDTGLELLSMHVGVVAFFDVGWVHGTQQGLSLGDSIRSVGCGLRVGSSNLFGDSVGRLDVAWPLDEVGGQGYSVSVSFTVGQVFTFFGNATELSREW